jgi:hypothetical protein
MKEGKLLLWDASDKESDLHEIRLDQRDWEIIQDVLEAHLEYLEDMQNDGALDDYDELFRVGGMVEFINSVKEE